MGSESAEHLEREEGRPIVNREYIAYASMKTGRRQVHFASARENGQRIADVVVKEYSLPDLEKVFNLERVVNSKLAEGTCNPVVPPVVDSFTIDDTSYLVFQYVHGEDAGERYGKMRELKGEVDLADVRRVLEGARDVLLFAHNRGIYHGDFKTDHILVPYDERPVTVIDWERGYHASIGALDQDGYIEGTPGFISPELIQEGGPCARTSATDAYAFAASVYDIITGIVPGGGKTPADDEMNAQQIVCNAVRGKIRNIAALKPRLPKRTAAAIMQGLHRDPEKRLGIAELVDALPKC